MGGGGGSKPVWRFSQKSSNLARGGFPQDGNGDFNNVVNSHQSSYGHCRVTTSDRPKPHDTNSNMQYSCTALVLHFTVTPRTSNLYVYLIIPH